MSQTVNERLLLSQRKPGQIEETSAVTLPHTSALTDTATEVQVEIPGVDPSTVGVHFEDNTLFIECEKGTLSLPVNPTIDSTKIKADILWGMLTLTIPLPAPPQSRSIKISVHDAVKKTPAKFTEEG